MNELYAKVYVDQGVKHDDLISIVADAVGGEASRWTVEAPGLEIDVRPNDDHRSPQRTLDADDFVYFPFALDVEAVNDGVSVEAFVGLLSKLMLNIRSAGPRLVVACDWESELPGEGRLGFE